jgi:hypothetical protein
MSPCVFLVELIANHVLGREDARLVGVSPGRF